MLHTLERGSDIHCPEVQTHWVVWYMPWKCVAEGVQCPRVGLVIHVCTDLLLHHYASALDKKRIINLVSAHFVQFLLALDN